MKCPGCKTEMVVHQEKDKRGIKFNPDWWQCPNCREHVTINSRNAQFIVRIAGGFPIAFMGGLHRGVYALAMHEVKPSVFNHPEEAEIEARSHGLPVGHFEIFPIKKPQ